MRRLRQPGGLDLGGYRYSAFGETVEDTVVLQSANPLVEADTRTQPLRWKGMWRYDFGGGVELYDARARMWSPKLGTFLSVDEFAWHDPSTTLWGWPGQNAIRWGDPFGRGRGAEDSRSGLTQALFDLSPSTLDATAGFGTGLLDNIPIWGIPGSPTFGDVSAQLGLAGQHPSRAGACGGGDGGDNSAANAGRVVGGIAGMLALGAAKGGGAAPSSRALGRALQAAGHARPAGAAAHHIVAGAAPAAQAARAVLAQLGIGINEAANGVFLPAAEHAALHTGEYYAAVDEALAGAATRAEAVTILESIAEGLRAGTFP